MAIRRSSRIQAVMRRARKAGAANVVSRRRRTPEQARDEALAAARKLFLAEGPDALTLQRLGAELGMAHTNLLHHFGSAAELQAALMTAMMSDLANTFRDAAARLEADRLAPRDLADLLFDAFEKGGGARLMAWMSLLGRREGMAHLEPALRELADAMAQAFAPQGRNPPGSGNTALLLLVLLAAGDALAGRMFKDIGAGEHQLARKTAASLVPFLFERR